MILAGSIHYRDRETQVVLFGVRGPPASVVAISVVHMFLQEVACIYPRRQPSALLCGEFLQMWDAFKELSIWGE